MTSRWLSAIAALTACAATRYEVRRHDRQAQPLGASDASGVADGRVCVPLTSRSISLPLDAVAPGAPAAR